MRVESVRLLKASPHTHTPFDLNGTMEQKECENTMPILLIIRDLPSPTTSLIKRDATHVGQEMAHPAPAGVHDQHGRRTEDKGGV